METLRKILEEADRNAVAVGHFNISDLVTLKAVFEAARELNVRASLGSPRVNGSLWAFVNRARTCGFANRTSAQQNN